MYPAFGWSAYWLLATMDISAHAISLADRPQWAIWVTSVRMRREDRSSISFYPLADLGGKGWAISSRAPYFGVADFAATHLQRSTCPRSFDRAPERSKRCGQACWRERSQARCDAAVSSPPRSRASARGAPRFSA